MLVLKHIPHILNKLDSDLGIMLVMKMLRSLLCSTNLLRLNSRNLLITEYVILNVKKLKFSKQKAKNSRLWFNTLTVQLENTKMINFHNVIRYYHPQMASSNMLKDYIALNSVLFRTNVVVNQFDAFTLQRSIIMD